MKKNWKLILVLLIIVVAVAFLSIKNTKINEGGNFDYHASGDAQSEYRSANLNVSFKYSNTKIKVEEEDISIKLYDKTSNDLLLNLSGDHCDVEAYNNLEKVSFGGQSFRKMADIGYFTIHPQTGICLIISVPRSMPAREYTAAEKKFVDDFAKNLIFNSNDFVMTKYEFSCNDGKSITASFVNNEISSVTIELSDQRAFSLMQSISASGARYVNKDESLVFWNKGDEAFLEENGKTTFENCSIAPKEVSTEIDNKINKIANPASTNCLSQGGKLEIKTKEDGSQYGLCYFDDARACEEWSMMRGECPVGGVKTTGYDNEAQKYCAWLGGKTTAEENSVCTFNDGSTCLNSDLYLDACQKGDWPK